MDTIFKQFLLFGGCDYYPAGGWDDFKGSYDTAQEAREARNDKFDWWQIINLTTGKEIPNQ